MCVELFCSLLLSTAGQNVLAEGQSGTRAYGWHTLSLTVEVSGDFRFLMFEKVSSLSLDSTKWGILLL